GSLRSGQSTQFTRGKRASPSRRACAKVDYSTLGDTSGGRLREGLCCAKQAATGWTLLVRRGRGHASLPKTERGLCVKEPFTGGVQQQRNCRSWWTHVLRQGPRGQLPARRVLRGQNLEGSQACRFARRAADKIRVGD